MLRSFFKLVNFKKKPYNLFLLTGFLLVLTSFIFSCRESAIDLHLHDTYFVISHAIVVQGCALILWLFRLIYGITQNLLFSLKVSKVHITITCLCFSMFAIGILIGDNFYSSPFPSYSFENWNTFKIHDYLVIYLSALLMVILAVQILYLINLILGIAKGLFAPKQ